MELLEPSNLFINCNITNIINQYKRSGINFHQKYILAQDHLHWKYLILQQYPIKLKLGKKKHLFIIDFCCNPIKFQLTKTSRMVALLLFRGQNLLCYCNIWVGHIENKYKKIIAAPFLMHILAYNYSKQPKITKRNSNLARATLGSALAWLRLS